MMSTTDVNWPMVNYFSAWKTFRLYGNEPIVTAEHVLSLPEWPKVNKLRLLDIGCGDGHMLQAFLSQCQHSISQVILLDPDERLLLEAVQYLESFNFGIDILEQQGIADEEGLVLAKKVDIGLAIHVVYLISHSRFRTLIEKWPNGVPLFIVLDAPGSVFSQIWNMTAPDYATRASRVHEYFSSVNNGGFYFSKSTFNTKLANPLTMDKDVRELVLSLLCYCNYTELNQKIKDEVDKIINQYVKNNFIECSCCCYAISRNL